MRDDLKVPNSKNVSKAMSECPEYSGMKLVFLRSEVFNVEAAVRRFVAYWDKRCEIFGENAFLLSSRSRMTTVKQRSANTLRWPRGATRLDVLYY